MLLETPGVLGTGVLMFNFDFTIKVSEVNAVALQWPWSNQGSLRFHILRSLQCWLEKGVVSKLATVSYPSLPLNHLRYFQTQKVINKTCDRSKGKPSTVLRPEYIFISSHLSSSPYIKKCFKKVKRNTSYDALEIVMIK